MVFTSIVEQVTESTVLDIVDKSLSIMGAREIVSAQEVVDLLLDIRQAFVSYAEMFCDD